MNQLCRLCDVLLTGSCWIFSNIHENWELIHHSSDSSGSSPFILPYILRFVNDLSNWKYCIMTSDIVFQILALSTKYSRHLWFSANLKIEFQAYLFIILHWNLAGICQQMSIIRIYNYKYFVMKTADVFQMWEEIFTKLEGKHWLIHRMLALVDFEIELFLLHHTTFIVIYSDKALPYVGIHPHIF